MIDIRPVLAGALMTTVASAPLPASAQAPDFFSESDSLGLIKNLYLSSVDGVSGNCWTNIEAVEQSARLKLEQSGVNVYLEPLSEDGIFTRGLKIVANGYRTDNGLCVGSIGFVVTGTAFREIKGVVVAGPMISFESSYNASGPSLNSTFKDAEDAAVSELASNILSGRRKEAVKRAIETNKNIYDHAPETIEQMKDRILNRAREQINE